VSLTADRRLYEPSDEARAGVGVVAATGMLGSGFREDSLEAALRAGARVIGCDAGSTDAGAASLATGQPQFSREAVKRDIEVLLRLAVSADVPVVIGSAGTAGGSQNLAWLAGIVRDVAREGDLHFELALIEAEQERETIHRLNREGRVRALPPATQLTDAAIDESLHIVAMMGVEPIQEALGHGAQVVVAGRTTDTAIYAAVPLMLGCNPGAAWHAAKVLECGAAAVTHRAAPDSMYAVIDHEGFDIWPLREDYRCTPQSVAAHSFYENANPFILQEPSGVLDLGLATYEQTSDRAVRVRGAKFIPAAEHTVKLEGARSLGYSTIVLGAVRDPVIVGQLDAWLEKLDDEFAARVARDFGDLRYEIVTRVYGKDGVMGRNEPLRAIAGHEVMLLWDVIAASQEVSHTIAASLAHFAVHYPVPEWQGLISTLAFPFSPAEIVRGEIAEFHLNHVAVLESPLELFPISYESL
jgi:hypothetical protein